MAQPYVGEIRMFAGNFAPVGWNFCDGSILQISENDTLFQLIGTTYGGDGQSTFGVPDLRGRVPIHKGGSFTLGETGGVETVTLTVPQMPTHSHPMLASSNTANQTTPQTTVLATPTVSDLYRVGMANSPMATQAVTSAGGNQPHENFQPYLCVNFIISLFGLYPSPP